MKPLTAAALSLLLGNTALLGAADVEPSDYLHPRRPNKLHGSRRSGPIWDLIDATSGFKVSQVLRGADDLAFLSQVVWHEAGPFRTSD